MKAATQHLEKFEYRQTITTPIASQDAYPILQDAQGQQCKSRNDLYLGSRSY